MYGFYSAFTICPAFPERDFHSFISFYFYTLTEKGGPKAALSIRKELSVMSTFKTLYLMIAFATLIVMMLK